MNIYQLHQRIEINKNNVSHLLNYVLCKNKKEALKKAFRLNEEDEIYALRVGPDTIKDEIAYCKELISYWEKKGNIKLDAIIGHQKSKIREFSKILAVIKEA